MQSPLKICPVIEECVHKDMKSNREKQDYGNQMMTREDMTQREAKDFSLGHESRLRPRGTFKLPVMLINS